MRTGGPGPTWHGAVCGGVRVTDGTWDLGPRCHVSEASSIDLMTPMVALVVDSITLARTVTLSASEAQNRITAALAP